MAGALLILTGLGISPYIRLDIALIALAGYYMLAAHSFLSARVAGELKLTYVAAGPTELRLILIGLTISMYAIGYNEPQFEGLGAFDLFVGGVGVANAVRAYLDGKRGVIATFKSLGASGGFVFAVYLVQMLIIAGIGIAIGLVLGALMPFAATAALASVIPVPAEAGIYPAALAMAALFGVLVTLAFALLPLGRARDVPATALFREMGFEAGDAAPPALCPCSGRHRRRAPARGRLRATPPRTAAAPCVWSRSRR